MTKTTTHIMIQLQDHLAQLSSIRGTRVIQPVKCHDGFMMSVQASSTHYCMPRSDVGPWTRVEVGYPSQIEPLLWPWAELPGDWTDTVYPHVPVEVVLAVIELHGGWDHK